MGRKARDLPVEQPKEFESVIKPEDSQADRPHDSAERVGQGGSGDSVRDSRAPRANKMHDS